MKRRTAPAASAGSSSRASHARTLLLIAGLLLEAGTGHAQAPVITPAGDPSVASDSIYALAVDPADHPEEDAVFLLDDGVLRYEPDGRGTSTFRQVVQILTADAAESYSEFSFGYEPGRERLTVNWIRVVSPDGTVLREEPALVQESDVPAGTQNPVYVNRKVIRATLSGVEPGTIVDFSTTREALEPYHEGDFFQSWAVSTGLLVRRSRLILDLPSGYTPRLVETNLDFPRRTTVAGERTVYEWSRAEIPRVRAEALAADSNDVFMHIGLGSRMEWADVARWYASLARDRYTMGEATRARVRKMVAEAGTREDTIRAVHRWVAQDIRYVSVSLGIGGYQPRTPDEVVETGFGDCKDKATLFVAALESLGITAYPVLLSSSGGVERRLPTIEQFDHATAAVVNPDGSYTFTDLTASLVPYGTLPYPQQGEFALVIRPDGGSEVRTMPVDPIEANESIVRLIGELSADGAFQGRYEVIGRGTHQYQLRDIFFDPLNPEQASNLSRAVASNVFTGASGSDLLGFDGKDLGEEARVSLRLTGARPASASGGSLIFTLPFGNMREMLDAAAELEARQPRIFPIDAEKVFGAQVSTTEMRVTLPEGMVARLPDPLSSTSPFGSYSVEYRQDGRDLIMVRRVRGARGIHPADRLGELTAWYRELARDDAQFIVLDRGESTP